MAGRRAGSVVTRYAGLQAQTSSAGVPIAIGWGTFRCKCNLVWYGAFNATAVKQSGGKGGGSQTTGYNYTASLVLGICEGPIDSISQVWVNSKYFAHGSVGSNVADTGTTSAMAQTGLTLATGAVGQAVWSYLTTNFPTMAIGYSGLAIGYAANYALDQSASPPNHSFEVVKTASFGVGSTPDTDPSLIMTDFFTNARTGVPSWPASVLDAVSLTSAANSYQAYCLAQGLLLSPVIDSQRSASDFLTELLRATNSTVVWSEGLLKFIPYGDAALTANGKTYTPNNTPVYALTDDHFIVDKDKPPVSSNIMDQSDAYNVVQLEYLDRTNQYNMAICLKSDAANVAQFGMRRKDPDTVHCICTPAVADTSAQLFLQRTLYIRAQYTFKLSWAFAVLEPGDLLEITDAGLGLATYMVRITQIDEDEKFGLTLTCEDYPIGVHNAPLYSSQPGTGFVNNQATPPGWVEKNLLIRSNDATNAAWTKSGAAATATATSDPFGGTTAQTLTASAGGTLHYDRQAVTTLDGSTGIEYTFSRYYKTDTVHFVAMEIGNAARSIYAQAIFNVNAGTAAAPTTVSTATNAVATITDAGSGWFRCTISATLTGVTSLACSSYVCNAGGTVSYSAAGTEAVRICAAQLEPGPTDTSYAQTILTPAVPVLFNPPAATVTPNVTGCAAVAGGSNWGGAFVWASIDGANYQIVGTINTPARYGIATGAFASGADPDTTHSVNIDLSASYGALTSAAQSVADAFGNVCLLDSEGIAFTTATLGSANQYNLTTYTRRGCVGTSIAAHSAGAPFVRLDDAIFHFPYLADQIGQTVMVKFQSFNLTGNGVQNLAQCAPYSFVPMLATPGPGTGSWTAASSSLSNGGVTVPAILVSGSFGAYNVGSVIVQYRVHGGGGAWSTAGVIQQYGPGSSNALYIAGVASGQSYDVQTISVVNGVGGAGVACTGSPVTVGSLSVGNQPGSLLLDDSATGTRTFTCPAGASYSHIDVVLTNLGGNGAENSGSKPPSLYGGSGGSVAVILTFAVVPGTTQIPYTLSAAISTPSTASCASGATFSLSAPSGISATSGGPAAAPTNATGGTHNYAGHAGGLVDTWDGGGAADINGSYTDQTSQNTNGVSPGGGGAGATGTGAGANIKIYARA